MTNTKEQTVWKTYPEYPFIQANQFGEIRTIDRTITDKNGSKRHYKGCVEAKRKQKRLSAGMLLCEWERSPPVCSPCRGFVLFTQSKQPSRN